MSRPAALVTSLAIAAVLALEPDAAAAGALHDAARNGDVTLIIELISGGADLEELDKGGNTPLIAAAYYGQDGSAAALLDRGADLGGRSDRGMTALHAAAYRGHEGIVALLLDRGADIDDHGNKFGITPLHAAAEEGNLPVVALLIDRGADLNLKEANAISALTRAGWKGHRALFEMLRRAGAACQSAAVTGPELFDSCMAIEPQDGDPSREEEP